MHHDTTLPNATLPNATLLHIINNKEAFAACQRYMQGVSTRASKTINQRTTLNQKTLIHHQLIHHQIVLIESAATDTARSQFSQNSANEPWRCTTQTWHYLINDATNTATTIATTGHATTGHAQEQISPNGAPWRPIDYPQFVTLCLSSDRCISW